MFKENKLTEIIRKVFKINDKKILQHLKKNKINLSDLKNYDSLIFLEFLSKIEKVFYIKVNNKNINKLNNFNSILKIINKNK